MSLLERLRKAKERIVGDGLIHCPVCGTTKLSTSNSGLWGYIFTCENGHRFDYDNGP